jgi:hypothetical protein
VRISRIKALKIEGNSQALARMLEKSLVEVAA